MERPRSPIRDYLKEIAWALFLLNLILGVVGLGMGAHLGYRSALALFLGTGAAISLLLGFVVLLNFLYVFLSNRWRRRSASGRDR